MDRAVGAAHGLFFRFSNYGGYYFLTRTRNPARFGLANLIFGDALRKECLQELQAHPPQAILAEVVGDTINCRPDLLPIRDYILENYEPKFRSPEFVLLTPRPKRRAS